MAYIHPIDAHKKAVEEANSRTAKKFQLPALDYTIDSEQHTYWLSQYDVCLDEAYQGTIKTPTWPWIDPEEHPNQIKAAPSGTYRAVKLEASHKSVTCMVPIHSNGLERVDGFQWELFHASHIGVIKEETYYWGMWIEGLGWFNVMVHESNTRELLPKEKEYWSNRTMSMIGSDSGNESYRFQLPNIE